MWREGDHITFRQVLNGRVWAAFPATIVEDSQDLVSVYVASGTHFAHPDCRREDHLRVAASGTWTYDFGEWIGHHLWSAVPGEACSIWTIWTEPDWTHSGWKINPEAPLRRTETGFDTTDHVLDAEIPPDLSRWNWKDEEGLEEAIELGLITDSEVSRIRRETSRIAREALTSRREKLREWASWRPPSDWSVPILNPDWNSMPKV